MVEDTYKKISAKLEAEWYPFHENEWFTHTDICLYFDWKEAETKRYVSRKLYHDCTEMAEPRLEKNNKAFRLVDRELNEIAWDEADPSDVFKLKFPYDSETGKGFPFEDHINLPPKSLVVVAGVSNAGKTTFLLNIVVRNMDDFDVSYFTSELSPTALKRRMIPFDQWYQLRNGNGKPKFKVYDKGDNFQDVIKPDGLNIIDYLDVNSEAEYFKMKPYLKRIKRALNRGIAVVALQKPPGRPDAYGGANMRGDTDLYLAMDFGKLTVVKAKDWQGEDPNGKMYKFNIESGGSMFTGIQEVYE